MQSGSQSEKDPVRNCQRTTQGVDDEFMSMEDDEENQHEDEQLSELGFGSSIK